jgi:hypothetical protein
MTGLLIDTDVLIDHLRELPAAVDFIEGQPEDFFISAVSVGELFAGVREGKERDILEVFLQGFEIIPVDLAIARQGGLFCHDFRKSHGVGLADARIAATAAARQLPLVTLNRKHFPMLKNLLVPYQKA